MSVFSMYSLCVDEELNTLHSSDNTDLWPQVALDIL